MDWKDVVPTVAQHAPTVAAALGGPAAGGVVSGAAQMVTSFLGIENRPEALVAALEDPEKRTELVRINSDHKRELEQMRLDAEIAHARERTQRLADTQETIRAELQRDGWFKSGWRPAIGWIFGFSLGAMAVALIYSMVRDPALVADGEVAGLMVWLIGTMGTALGINVRERTKAKQMATGEQPGGFMDALVKKRKEG